jgi:hypothetical protein
MNASPDDEPPGLPPLATGLTEQDIRQLLALIRTKTAREILGIWSRYEGAEVVTGHLADMLQGEGEAFQCVRGGQAWQIEEAGTWRGAAGPIWQRKAASFEEFAEFDPIGCLPFADGLSDCDIHELLQLIRTQSNREVLSIRSERHGAGVWTGFLANGEAGEGEDFQCVRREGGWEIRQTGEWIA